MVSSYNADNQRGLLETADQDIVLGGNLVLHILQEAHQRHLLVFNGQCSDSFNNVKVQQFAQRPLAPAEILRDWPPWAVEDAAQQCPITRVNSSNFI